MCDGGKLINDIYKNTAIHQHGSGPCDKKISTTIDENSDYIIYCDECYKKEIY
jgi:hypothetical protein